MAITRTQVNVRPNTTVDFYSNIAVIKTDTLDSLIANGNLQRSVSFSSDGLTQTRQFVCDSLETLSTLGTPLYKCQKEKSLNNSWYKNS